MTSPPYPEDNDEPARIVAAHRSAVAFYRAAFGGSPAERYVRNRLGTVPRGWTIGYAPPLRQALTRYLRRGRVTDHEIVAAGLAYPARGDGGLVDRFRGRVVFPVHVGPDEPVGFIGRICPGIGRGPKYLNTPTTPVYTKSTLLFGLVEQRRALADGARPVLVEGPMDVLAVAAADRACRFAAVAPGGTAYTGAHLEALATAADPTAGLVVALDPDSAGRRATKRLWAQLVAVGLAATARAATLPAGLDPGALLEASRSQDLRHALGDGSTPLVDAVVDATIGVDVADADIPVRVAALHRAAAVVVATRRPEDMVRFAAHLADRLRLAHSAVTIALTDALTGHGGYPQAPSLSTERGDRNGQPRSGVMRCPA